MDDTSYNVRIPKRWVRVALIVGATALVVAPLTAVATHSFTDVPNDNTFHADIEWLKDAGVTLGCNPPVNDRFCPKDNVTREQMSAFMRRLAENQVVDAATAQTADSAGIAHDVAADVPGVALAGVTVLSNGSVVSSFNRLGGTPSVSQPNTGTYDITIPGASIPTNATGVNQQATPRTTLARTATVSGFEGNARVRIFTSDGTLNNTPFTYVLIGPLSQVTGASSSVTDGDPEHSEG